MKALIRPTLFTLARLGFFLAVVAWVMGQWWELRVHNNASPCWGELNADAWLVTNFPFDDPYGGHDSWNLQRMPREKMRVDTMALVVQSVTSPFQFPGLTVSVHDRVQFLVIRHWLIVAGIALFYGVLKWVYRKRPEAADE